MLVQLILWKVLVGPLGPNEDCIACHRCHPLCAACEMDRLSQEILPKQLWWTFWRRASEPNGSVGSR